LVGFIRVYSNLELARHRFYVPSTQLPTGQFFGVQTLHPRGTLSRFVAIHLFHLNIVIRLIHIEPYFGLLHQIMASWSHFLAGHGAVNPDQSSDHRNCFRSSAATTTTSSTSPGVVLLIPEKFEHSLDSILLRRLSSNSLQDMSQNHSDSSLGSYQAAETTIPRRNLTEAFEELYIEAPAESAVTPAVKGSDNQGMNGAKLMTNMISPTGVADLPMEQLEMSADTTPERSNLMAPRRDESKDSNSENDHLPHFFLHPDLKRELSQALVNRVSFYGVLHDINKEATAMASNDDSGYNRLPEDMLEEYDALVVAVNGFPQKLLPTSTSMSKVALIDEERWLLEAIDARGLHESRSIQACPPTFHQAMGERDYENPLASLSTGSRTQLWKPSRSWWEAKSGKNPWIEPKSHNKRWR
jgi:hypothetical protein